MYMPLLAFRHPAYLGRIAAVPHLRGGNDEGCPCARQTGIRCYEKRETVHLHF